MKNKVYVVLVTYEPDMVLLKKCINSLNKQTNKVIIVDNTPLKCKELEFYSDSSNIDVIYLDSNHGIAYAQNIGIKKALEDGADYILTSDQDTIYPDEYIKNLFKCFDEVSKIGKVATVSPIYTDENKNKQIQPMVYFKNGFLYKDYKLDECKSVSHVISSGMLIPCSVLKDVGLMNENLYIDWVDTEWCWRAISNGYKIIQTPKVQIDHCLGNLSQKIGNKVITVHNSFRNYYKIRNAIYLLFHSNSLDVTMKFFTLQQILKMMIVHPLTSTKKIEEIIIIIKGIKDGVLSNMGAKI